MQESRPTTPHGSVAAPLPHPLTEHWEWTRALARQLIRDPHDAEDAAQDAWLLARRSVADGDRSVHLGFLRSILRNLTREQARSRRNREGRQAEAVQRREIHREADLTPDEMVARAETGRHLCAAVLALPVVHRDVVLQRYFQGLSNREIARRSGVPQGTIRSRLKRGLDQIRQQFDEGAPGRDRRSLACLVGPVTGGSVAGGAKVQALMVVERMGAGLATRSNALMVLGTVVVAAMVVAATSLHRAGAATPEVQWTESPVELAAGPVRLIRAGDSKGTRTPVAGTPAAGEASEQVMELRGTVVDVHRKPVAGAQLVLRGSAFAGDDVHRLQADARGLFRLTVNLKGSGSGAMTVSGGPLLSARIFRFGGAGLGLNRPPSAGVRELGEVLLSPRGKVTAQVISEVGEPITGERLYLRPAPGGPGFMVKSGAGGRLDFDCLREGDYELRALNPRYEQKVLASVTVAMGKAKDLGRIALIRVPDGQEMVEEDLEIMDHNESDVSELTATTNLRGHVLRDGVPVPGLDVTAVPVHARDRYSENVPLGDVPVNQWTTSAYRLSSDRNHILRAVTDHAGRFVLTEARPGVPYRVVAWGTDDHAVIHRVVPEEPIPRLRGERNPVRYSLGALEMVPYASVDLKIDGARGLRPSEFELIRHGLDNRHVVAADSSGVIRLNHVIAGPHVMWLQPIRGRFSKHCRVAFDAEPGESQSVPVEAVSFGLEPVSFTLTGTPGPSPGFRAIYRPADSPALAWESEKGPIPASLGDVLFAKPGEWRVEGTVRSCRPAVLEVALGRRLVRLEVPPREPGSGGSVEMPLDGGASLLIFLPESAEFLSQGRLEFIGPRTSLSTTIVEGEVDAVPWGVESTGSGCLVIRGLHQDSATVAVRVVDMEPGRPEQVLLERRAQIEWTGAGGAVLDLR